MHASFLKTTRDPGDTRFKGNQAMHLHILNIYTYLTFHSLHDNWKIMEKLFTQQGKSYKGMYCTYSN